MGFLFGQSPWGYPNPLSKFRGDLTNTDIDKSIIGLPQNMYNNVNVITDDLNEQKWKSFIAAKEEVLIGGLTFLNNWIIRSETSDALDKLFVKNIITETEEELIFSDEKVYVPGVSLIQKNKDTDEIYLGYSSPKTQSRVYLYNLETKEKKLITGLKVVRKAPYPLASLWLHPSLLVELPLPSSFQSAG